jgi:hypothetical protein
MELENQSESLFNNKPETSFIKDDNDNLFNTDSDLNFVTGDKKYIEDKNDKLFEFSDTELDKSKETTQEDDDLFLDEFLDKSPETDYKFWRMHPAEQILEMDDVFQQEWLSGLSVEEKQAMGILPLETGELGPAQIIGELSVLKGAREVVQQTLDFSAYLSPFYGGDKWWNGFGKGRMEGEALGQELFTLPEVQAPEDPVSKTVELVTEFFAPGGLAVRGTKLYSQVLTGAQDIQKFAGKFSRGEDIGSFAVGFGMVDMALVDPSAPNLAAMLKENVELEGPVNQLIDALATDPNNTEAMNRFVRTVEGMGIGFAFDSAFWLGKIISTGVAKGTIKAIKPLDQDLFNYMRGNMPERISTAQYMWGIMQEFNPKRWYNNFIFNRADDLHGLKLLQQDADQTTKVFDVEAVASKEFQAEFKRIKDATPGISDDMARAQAHHNLGTKPTAGQLPYIEFKLLKNAGRVIDSFFNTGTVTWKGVDAQGKEVIDYSRLQVTGEGFAKSISKHITTKTQLLDFENYLIALRAKNLYQRGYKGKDILPKFDIKKINQYIKNGNNNPAFKAALKDLQSYNRRLMDFAVDSGLISRESANKMLNANPVYVPFYRVSESVATDGGFKLSVKEGTTKQPFKNFTGSGGMIQSPYESLLKNTAIIVEASLRNRANITLANYLDRVVPIRKQAATALANQYNLKGQQRRDFINDYTNKWAEKVSGADITGFAQIDKKSLKEQLEKQGIKDINIDDPGINDWIKIMHFSKRNIRTKDGQALFMVMRDGVPEFYKVNDDMIKHVIDEFGYKSYHQMDIALKGLNVYKRWVSSLITKDPGFAFYSNAVRDSFGGAMNSTTWGRIPLIDVPVNAYRAYRGMFGTTTRDHEQFLEYINNGGGFGTIFTQNAEQYGFQLKKYFSEGTGIKPENVITNSKNLWDRYTDMVTMIEHSVRFSEFKRLKKLGYSEREAAVLAREISVDFSMRGANSIQNHVSQIVPFFNPAIQGAYKSYRTWKNRPVSTFIKTNMYAGAPTAYLWYVNHDNPDYQQYPDWAKRQAWFVPVGETYDENLGRNRTQFILIPKPFDLYGMYANTMEASLNTMHDLFTNEKDYESASDIVREFVKTSFANAGHALPPVPLPPAANLGFALFGNIDTFTGTSIIPKRLENVPDELQFTPWTSETVKLLGDKTGVSPMLIEQVYAGFFPGLGEKFLHLADFSTNLLTDNKYSHDKGPLSLEDIPILDRIYEDGLPQITQQELDMFDAVEDGLDEFLSEQQVAELFFADEERINNYFNDPDNLWKIEQRPLLFEYLKLTGSINNEIRLVFFQKDINQDVKHRKILKLNQQKRDLATTYLDALNKLKKYRSK